MADQNTNPVGRTGEDGSPASGPSSSRPTTPSGPSGSQSSGNSSGKSSQSCATTKASQLSFSSGSGGSSQVSSGSSGKDTASEAASVATLPAEDAVDGFIEDPAEEEDANNIWGMLIAYNNKLFQNISMTKDTYNFGRDVKSDHVFLQKDFRHNMSMFHALSKTHFKIIKETYRSRNTNDYTVFLVDTSTNGTFINGELVGRNQKKALVHNSEISLALEKNKAYLFLDRGDSDIEQGKYPKDVTKKYTISKVLGRGACGEVRLAFDKNDNSRHAVKIINKKTFSVTSKLPKPMMDEVNILQKLEDPGIIKVGDVYDEDNALYIFLELVEGGELFDRVRDLGAFKEPIAKLLFYQMLVAVNYLHENGITHRDLKPENVLLTTDSQETGIKITDFGLSRFVGENSLMKTLCGTPNYLAPEVIRNAGVAMTYSKIIDCWSLGCILYICLGGYPPFSDHCDGMGLFEQVQAAHYSFPKKQWGHVSAEGIDLIRQLLTVDPKKRLSVSEALKHPWLQDEEMQAKAEKIRQGIPLATSMPPPPIIPISRKSSSTDGSESPESSKRKLSPEETPESKKPKISSGDTDVTDELAVTSSTGF